MEGNENNVKYLVEQEGADIHKEDRSGETLLFKACSKGNGNIVKYLVDQKVNLNKSRNDGVTPLNVSVKNDMNLL